MIQFAYTILYVKDVTASVAFYEQAFEMKRKFITPDASYGELVTGDTTLAFASVELAKTNFTDGFTESSLTNRPFGFEIGFTTNNVEEAVDKAVKAGAVALEEAKRKPHGQTVAYVKDPDGFLIEICTPIR